MIFVFQILMFSLSPLRFSSLLHKILVENLCGTAQLCNGSTQINHWLVRQLNWFLNLSIFIVSLPFFLQYQAMMLTLIFVPPGLCKPQEISFFFSLSRCFYFRSVACRRFLTCKIFSCWSFFHCSFSAFSFTSAVVLSRYAWCSATVAFLK